MKKILIVEDDDLMQGMLTDALSKKEYFLVIAGDGEEGWKKFQSEKFDLILLDLKLPKIDGLTLLKKIKADASECDIIMMTAFATVESAVEAMKCGAFDYITKPFLSEELLFLVEKTFEFQRLKNENTLLKQELNQRFSLGNIIGKRSG